MCKSNSTTATPATQVKSRGLSLASADGYRVSCVGMETGDYAVMADTGADMHVVSVTEDVDGRRFYACTCHVSCFYHPVPESQSAVCDHISAVRNFLQIAPERIEELLNSIIRVSRGMLQRNARRPARPVPQEIINAKIAEAARAQDCLKQRRAATIRRIPVRITQPEAAGAASLVVVAALLADLAAVAGALQAHSKSRVSVERSFVATEALA